SEAVRVVHQDVDRAVPAHGLLDHRLHVAALADVDHRRHALATVGADLLRRALRTVELDFRDADLGALTREEECDGATDTLPRTRHDGDLAVEAAHFPPPFGDASVEPAVQPPGAPLVGQDGVLHGAAHAPLHVGRDAHALHELERLVAV